MKNVLEQCFFLQVTHCHNFWVSLPWAVCGSGRRSWASAQCDGWGEQLSAMSSAVVDVLWAVVQPVFHPSCCLPLLVVHQRSLPLLMMHDKQSFRFSQAVLGAKKKFGFEKQIKRFHNLLIWCTRVYPKLSGLYTTTLMGPSFSRFRRPVLKLWFASLLPRSEHNITVIQFYLLQCVLEC